MRFFQLSILLLFLVAVAVFALQNNVAMDVRFLIWKVSLPTSLQIVGIYLLGMISGGAVVGFVRRSISRLGETSQTTTRG